MIRHLSLVALTVIAFAAVGGAQGGASQSGDPKRIGTGANTVYVFRPDGPICSAVIFGHGWTDYTPENYMPWFDHLRANGSAIVFPQYQTTGSDPAYQVTGSWQAGLRAGFEELSLDPDVPVIVAGYSAGGPLAFQTPLWAKNLGFRMPYAVHSIYPAPSGLSVTGIDRIPRSVRVWIQVGARDDVVGNRGGKEIWRALAGHPRKRKHYQVVGASSGVAYHLAPLRDTRAARQKFWAPLDRSIAEAQRAASKSCTASSG
jgi:hypothetical protein